MIFKSSQLINKLTGEFEFQRYNLKENDILYFSHIPKTAGTTLITILDNYFPEETVLKAHDWQSLLPTMSLDFTKYRFVRGHFGYSILKYFSNNPICITMLRDPVDTVISSYKMSQRQESEANRYKIQPEWSMSEMILQRPMIKNRQACYLTADLDIKEMIKDINKEELKNYYPEHQNEFCLKEISEEKLLAITKQNILNFAFVGIVEKMEESLFLLHYQFGWKPIRNIMRENISPSDQNSALSEEAKNQILDRTKVDREIYSFANKIFDFRYEQMVKELKKKYYNRELEKMEPNDAVFEMLNLDHNQKDKDLN